MGSHDTTNNPRPSRTRSAVRSISPATVSC
jgi:hypothetical protein